MDMDEKIRVDHNSRRSIVSRFDTNFFVEAGAGSGKTTMLVNRMVAMVEQGLDIRKICAITFTVAAAGEFYKRFQELLLERSNPDCEWDEEKAARPGSLPKPTEKSARLCKEALENIDLCFMGTIDSFCNRILSEHPSEAKIPSDACIISDEEKEGILRQEYVKLLRGEYGSKLAKEALLFQNMHQNNAEDAFLKGMTVILDHYGAEFNFTKRTMQEFHKELDPMKAEILPFLKLCVDHESEMKSGRLQKSRVAWEQIRRSTRELNCNWEKNMNTVWWAFTRLSGLCLSYAGAEKYDPDGAYLNKYYGDRKNCDYICYFPDDIPDKLSEYKYSFSMEFLVDGAEKIMNNLRKSGKLSFYDYLLYLRNMLKEDAKSGGKLIRYIFERHSYFLIDEFQDTNPMQAEIFFYLTAEKPVEKWQDCIPRPGSLFVVGDPKQSIYRFRSADVTSYLKVKKLFERSGGECLYLTRNFRSTRELCDYFNRMFRILLDTETASQSKFDLIPPKGETPKGVISGVYTYEIANGTGGRMAHPEKCDEVRVRKIIETLVDNPKYKIIPKDEKNPRMITYKDFKIVPLAKKQMPEFITELESHGIPTIAEGKVLFERCRALKAIYAIYASVINPFDRIALVRALKSILLHQSEENLARYQYTGRALSLIESEAERNMRETSETREEKEAEEETEGKEAKESASGTMEPLEEDLKPVQDALKHLRELSGLANHVSPAALFEKILDDFRIYRYLPLDHPEIVYYALEMIRNAENSGEIVSHMEGKKFIEELLSGEDNPERCLKLKEELNCVNLVNLHKVKGLEAPIVILAYGFHSDAPIVSSRIVHNENSTDAYIFDVSEGFGKDKKVYFETSEPDYLLDAEAECLREEDLRKIYVGATRGRNVLIVSRLLPERASSSFWQRLEDGLDPKEDDFFNNFSRDEEEEYVSRSEDASGAGSEAKEADEKDAAAKNAVDADTLYDRAEQTCVLSNVDALGETYELKLPSKLKKAKANVSSATEGAPATENEKDEISVSAAILEDPDDERLADTEERLVQAGEEKAEVALAHKRSDILGTLVHRLMECLVLSRNSMDSEILINQVINEQKEKSILPLEGEMKKALTVVCKTIRNGGYEQINGVSKDILTELLSAEEVYCETPFCYKEGTVVWNGVMDVIYKKDGNWHILDYKTNIDGSNLDAEYAEQLNAYIHALKEIMGVDADAKIYHIGV